MRMKQVEEFVLQSLEHELGGGAEQAAERPR